MSDVGYLVSNVGCLVSNEGYSVSNVGCLVSDVGYSVSNVECLVSDVGYSVSNVGCLVSSDGDIGYQNMWQYPNRVQPRDNPQHSHCISRGRIAKKKNTLD